MDARPEIGKTYTFTGADTQPGLKGKTGTLVSRFGDIGTLRLPVTGDWTVMLANLTPHRMHDGG